MGLKEKYGAQVQFIIADTETQEGYELAMQFGIRGIPAFHFINSTGEVVEKKVGSQSSAVLEAALRSLLE